MWVWLGICATAQQHTSAAMLPWVSGQEHQGEAWVRWQRILPPGTLPTMERPLPHFLLRKKRRLLARLWSSSSIAKVVPARTGGAWGVRGWQSM